MLVFGVPVANAVPLLAISAVHVVLGGLILIRLQRAFITSSEFLGFGYAIGTVVAVSVDQIFVATAFRNYSWTLLVLTIIVLFRLQPRRARKEDSITSQETGVVTLATLTTLALFVLAQERYWPAYLALGMFPLAFYSQYRVNSRERLTPRNWLLAIVALLAAIASFLQILRSRPGLWWIKTQDYQFFESLSYSLAHWGSHDQIYASGYAVKYHWFSYAYIGMLSRIIHADEWQVLTRGSPVLVAVGILLIAHAVFERLIKSNALLPMAMVVFVLLNDFNFESFSMVHSYIWLLPAIWLCAGFVESPRVAHFTIAPLLAAGAFGAKSSNAAIILATVFVVALYTVLKKRSSVKTALSLLLAHGVALGVVYFNLYWNSPYSETVEFGIAGVARDLFGDLRDLNRPLLIVASMIVLGNLIAVSSLSLWWYSRRVEARYVPLQVVAVAAVTSGVLLLAIIRSEDYEIEEYFLHAMVLITSIVTSLLVAEVFSLNHQGRLGKNSRIILCLLGISTGAAVSLWPVTNEGGVNAAFARVAIGSPILLVGALCVIITAFGSRLRRRVSLRVSVAAMTIVGIGAANVRWFTEYPTFRDEVTSSQHRQFMLGSQDVIEGAELVNQLTNEDDIIASNYFCETVPCSPAEYRQNRINWKRGGEAMTLAVYSHRRFWVTGYGFLWQNVKPPQELLTRIEESLTSVPPESGVVYFLRDRSMPCSCSNDWRIVGESRRFQLFKL